MGNRSSSLRPMSESSRDGPLRRTDWPVACSGEYDAERPHSGAAIWKQLLGLPDSRVKRLRHRRSRLGRSRTPRGTVIRSTPCRHVGYRARRSAPITPARRRHANRSKAKANFVRSSRRSSMEAHIPRTLRHQSRCTSSPPGRTRIHLLPGRGVVSGRALHPGAAKGHNRGSPLVVPNQTYSPATNARPATAQVGRRPEGRSDCMDGLSASGATA